MSGLLHNFLCGLFSGRDNTDRQERLLPGDVKMQRVMAESFEEYQQQSQKMLRDFNDRRTDPFTEEVISRNAAYYLKPEQVTSKQKRSVLIVHGLTDTPFSTRDLGHYFSSRGFHVLAILLPGHGTCPGDLLNVTSKDWIEAVADAVALAKKETDEVYLAGFSLGATLVLHQVLCGVKVKGVLVFSPAIRLVKIVSLSCLMTFFSRWIPRFKWLDILPDTDPHKYETLAMNAVCESTKLIKQVRLLLGAQVLKIPVFVSASEDDATVIGREALLLYTQVTSPFKRMIYYARRAMSAPAGVRLVTSCLPEQCIVSAAHTSAYVHPQNTYYGRGGSFAACSHLYRTNPEGYLRCKAFNEDLLGEIGVGVGRGEVLRRLTYNPWFDLLEEELDKYFINTP